jgi:circadian clock protein KaiB
MATSKRTAGKPENHGVAQVKKTKATSIRAFENLKRLCEEHMHGAYKIQVVDLLERPMLARGDQIIAVPTLVRRLPTPVKKIIGDLSNTERVLVGLDLRPAGGWR